MGGITPPVIRRTLPLFTYSPNSPSFLRVLSVRRRRLVDGTVPSSRSHGHERPGTVVGSKLVALPSPSRSPTPPLRDLTDASRAIRSGADGDDENGRFDFRPRVPIRVPVCVSRGTRVKSARRLIDRFDFLIK